MGRSHSARLDTSARLQRTLLHLADGKPHTTRDIVRGADVVAVNSCISELRVGGWDITCKQIEKDRFTYQLHDMQIESACNVLMGLEGA